MFWDQDAMAMHVALVAECLDDFAGQVPRVLLGDFNIKPEDSGYRMLTTGHLAGDVEARIQHRFFPGWRLKLQAPLASAYCLARGIPGAGGEPAYVS
jgi:endonuclease/exonuclease/phosphatase family metal-dependent hydrolase